MQIYTSIHACQKWSVFRWENLKCLVCSLIKCSWKELIPEVCYCGLWRLVVWQMYVNVTEEMAMFILKIQDMVSGFIWSVGTHLPCYMASHPAIPQYWHSQQICQIPRRKDHLHCLYLLHNTVLEVYLSSAQPFKWVWITKYSVAHQTVIRIINWNISYSTNLLKH